MKHKKVAILDISALEGETFKNFLIDHPFKGIDVFYFQDKETILTISQDGASLILEENRENLIDFPLIIDFKKKKKENYELEGSIIYANPSEEGKLIFYGINHKNLLKESNLRMPHPLSCLFLRIFENFKKNQPEAVFCNTVLSTSEEGKEGQDELYNQTLQLLNFSNISKKVYEGQIAFNMILISDSNFPKRLESEINYFFENSFPIHLQFVKSGIFFGILSFLNIVFPKREQKISFKKWLLEKEDFVFNLKNEGVVEAVQMGKIFIKINEIENKNNLNLIIIADPLYSGMSYNLYNLIEEFFNVNIVLK